MQTLRFPLPRASRVGLVCTAALLSGIVGASAASADDKDKFDGAIWNFTMTPKRGGLGLEPLKGGFRVFNHVLYQRSKPPREKKEANRDDFDKVVGKNHPQGKRTRVEMKDFRAFDKNMTWHSGLKGSVLLTIDRFGEWSGTFVDSEGRHWDFKCTRVQE